MSDQAPVVTDEAVEAAYGAYMNRDGYHRIRGMRAALEAAAPLLGPRPLPHRAAAVKAAADALYHDRWSGDPTEGQFVGERYDDAEHEAGVAVDAVLALLNGAES